MLIYLLSVVLSRQRDSLNSLGFSVTVIAMENPFSIGALGLQLSVLSTAGLILYFQFLQPLIYEKIDSDFILILIAIMSVSLFGVIFCNSTIPSLADLTASKLFFILIYCLVCVLQYPLYAPINVM